MSRNFDNPKASKLGSSSVEDMLRGNADSVPVWHMMTCLLNVWEEAVLELISIATEHIAGSGLFFQYAGANGDFSITQVHSLHLSLAHPTEHSSQADGHTCTVVKDASKVHRISWEKSR